LSDWADFCDAWVSELTNNVAGLTSAVTHKYSPWDPEALAAANGERHLAIWPEGGTEHETPGFVTNGFILRQSYLVLVWEGAQDEAGRLVLDEAATKDFLDLENAVRARFFLKANVRRGSVDEVRAGGVQLPQPSGGVRSFAWRLLAVKGIDLT
jgi:hypothetical protein